MGMRQKLGAALGVVGVAGLLAVGAISPAVAAKAPRCGDHESSDSLHDEASAAPQAVVGLPTYTVKKAGVAYRIGPGTQFRQLGVLRQGGIIVGTGTRQNGWTRFSLTAGGTAWVASAYLAGARYPVFQVTVRPGSVLVLRSGPGVNNRQIGQLASGVYVPGTGKSKNGWLQLQLVSGTIGWSSGRYLRKLPAAGVHGTLTTAVRNGPIDPPVVLGHPCSDDEDDYSW